MPDLSPAERSVAGGSADLPQSSPRSRRPRPPPPGSRVRRATPGRPSGPPVRAQQFRRRSEQRQVPVVQTATGSARHSSTVRGRWRTPGTMPSRRRSSSQRLSAISASPAPVAAHAVEARRGPRSIHAARVHGRSPHLITSPCRPCRPCSAPCGRSASLGGPRLRSRRPDGGGPTWRYHDRPARARPARLPRDRLAARRRGAGDPRHRAPVRPRAGPAGRRRLVRAGDPPARADRGARQARALRDAPRRLRAPGRQRRRLRARVPRARGRRLRRAQRRLGAGIAGDVLDLEVGLRGAEAALATPRCTPARRSAASA